MTVESRRGVDHIGVVVCAVVHDGKGNVVLIKRSKGARDEHGHWDICGGALEFGESIEDAIRREVVEELCARPLEVNFLEVGDAHRVNDKGEKTHWVWLLHSVVVDPKEVKIGEPHKFDDLGWFNQANLPAPLHSQFPKILEVAKRAGIIK